MFSQVSVSHSVHNWPHGYSVTAHPCHGGRYASYLNDFWLFCVCENSSSFNIHLKTKPCERNAGLVFIRRKVNKPNVDIHVGFRFSRMSWTG